MLSADDASIADFEALLIKAMNLQNRQNMNFTSRTCEEWAQVPSGKLVSLLDKICA